MKKSFLLMLFMALLPLASWAQAPGAISDLKYTGSPLALVTAGGDESYYFYAVVADGADKPTAGTAYGAEGVIPTATEAGDYDVYYLGGSFDNINDYTLDAATKVDVTIDPATNNAVSDPVIADWAFGATPSTPTATATYGTSTIQFMYSDNVDGAYSSTPPTAVGTWYVRAFVDATPNYNDCVSAATEFEITKAEPTVTLYSFSQQYAEGDDWIEPTTETLPVTAYKVEGANWDDIKGFLTFTRAEGQEGGFYDYTLKQTSGKENYQIYVSTGSFQITKAMPNAVTVALAGWTYGAEGTPKTPTATATYGQATAYFQYATEEAGTYGEYADVVNDKPGTYWVKAIIDETKSYVGAVSTPVSFTIEKADATITVDPATYGLSDEYTYAPDLKLNPTGATTTSDGTPYYAIAPKGSSSSENLTGWTPAAGEWDVWAIVLPTDYYKKAEGVKKTIKVNPAKAFTATAPATLTASFDYDAEEHDLFTVNEGTVTGVVEYSVNGGTWSTTLPGKVKWANDYKVSYRVTNPNYEAVAATELGTVTVSKILLTVKVNTAEKVYDATKNNINDAGIVTVQGGKDQFEIMNIKNMPATDQTKIVAVEYHTVGGSAPGIGKIVATWEGFLTVLDTELDALIGGPAYEWVIMPGDLVIKPRPLKVKANTGLTKAYGTSVNIEGEWTVECTYAKHKSDPAETIDDVFSVYPALGLAEEGKSTEDLDLDFGKHALKFVEGTKILNDQGNCNYDVTYDYTDADFEVTEGSAKLVISVVNQTVQYGETVKLEGLVAGTDYYVANMQGDDTYETLFKTAPTFTSTAPAKPEVGSYDLLCAATKENLKNPGRYASVQIVQGTFEVTPRVLTYEIPSQTVAKGATTIDKDKWTVTEGLQYGETQSDLKGEITLDKETTAVGSFDDGLKLTINNTNYTFDAGGAPKQEAYGTLIVIDGTTPLIMTKESTEEIIAAADPAVEYNVTISGRPVKAKSWQVFVLPFDVDPFDFMEATGDNTAVFNILESIETADVTSVKFGATIDVIPANTPFLVKPQKDWDADFTFSGVKIVAPAGDPVVEKKAGKFIGTYKEREVGEDEFYALQGGSFKKFTTPTVKIGFLRAYITLDSSAPARFFVEEEDGTTTAIDGLEFNNIIAEKNAEGWYTVNGMKLNAAPTQKGTYIKDGKKVFVK